MADDAETSRGILIDGFGRAHALVPQVLDGLSAEDRAFRPNGTGNSIAWLIWHLIRVEDAEIGEGLAAGRQVWRSEGWYERSGLPFDPAEHGYGQSSEQVDQCAGVDPELLIGYHEAVHERTVAFLREVDTEELGRVIDPNWDPPVTVGTRSVSVLADQLQHIGQAAYLRGLLGHPELE
jgi:hypothetical protein